MNKLTRNILEHIINKMLKHQNEWTDLFIEEINTNYKNALNEAIKESKEGIYFCGWYFFVIKNNKATFHIAKCAK